MEKSFLIEKIKKEKTLKEMLERIFDEVYDAVIEDRKFRLTDNELSHVEFLNRFFNEILDNVKTVKKAELIYKKYNLNNEEEDEG